jgi:hypothetical protein
VAGLALWPDPGRKPEGHQRAFSARGDEPRRTEFGAQGQHSLGNMRNSAPTVDEAALGRLRLAIAVEDGDEEEQQLHGVLRMLGAEVPDGKQIPLFGRARPSRGARLDEARLPRPYLSRFVLVSRGTPRSRVLAERRCQPKRTQQ